ncbi:putative 54S ribosomal protein L35, mitochondrial [Xylogone sp. PMI_703]|nr:putative 54S ribosomal protein L35, mitochondrial [Xylogone sp. PMI_703]
MSGCQKAARPLTRGLRNLQQSCFPPLAVRSFTSTAQAQSGAAAAVAKTPDLDPATVTNPKQERALMRSGVKIIGSRRRRAALRTSQNIPFEQLPYQCFQEARKVLAEDREEKIKAIETERLRIATTMARDAATFKGGEQQKQNQLDSMQRHLERLKILADINDPVIKKLFEDGQGDMNKPIYRYLADRKWRSYQRLLILQRINQLNVIPDVLPHFEPTADVRLAFSRRNVQPGDIVDSRVSEIPARLNVQVFDKGERLVSVVVIDSDVPEVDTDNFSSRCHFLAANIPLSPTETSIPLIKASKDTQLIHSWLPPFAQKGSPYHRYSVFILEQQPGQTLDVTAVKEKVARENFSLRSFVDKFGVKPIGASVFRSIWDDGTMGVMQRHNIEGWDIEFKRKKIEPLKPKQKPRGWEAKHSTPKYRALWR